jgi:O-antigen ligase
VAPDDPESQFGLKLLLQVPVYGLFAVAAAGLSGRAAERAMTILVFALVALGCVLVAEGLSTAWGYRQIMAAVGEPIRPDLAERNVGKGQFVLALLAWPALVFLQRERHRLVPLLVGSLAVCALVLNELAPLAGFLAGGVAFLLVRAAGPVGARLAGGLLALQVLVSPWLVRGAEAGGLFGAVRSLVPESSRQRLDIWSFAAERISERQWFGWGLEASRTMPAVPLHPHNAALQVWLELGLIGAILFALIWLRVFESVARVAARDRTAAR